MSDDRIHIEVPVLEGELIAPPERYAVPAVELPPLEEGTLVSYGRPGAWWAIDEAYTATPPHGAGEDESYGIVPLAEELAMMLRPGAGTGGGQDSARGMWIDTRDLWVYRDGGDQDVRDVEEWRPIAWFDRLPSDDRTPPPVRRPRPARELPSLTGRRLRAYGGGRWHWVVAVTEPRVIEDSITVKVVDLHRHGRLLGGRSLADGEPGLVSLHRLWAY